MIKSKSIIWEGDFGLLLCPLSKEQLVIIQKLEDLNQSINGDKHDEPGETIFTLREIERFNDSAESKLENEDDIRFRCFVDNLKVCTEIYTEVGILLNHLNYLKKAFEAKVNKITSIQAICNNIIEKEKTLIVAVNGIKEKLNYFRELEIITKKLGSSSVLILNESLMQTLSRLDECLNFLISKPNYMESEKFIEQFQILKKNTLETIKKYIIKYILSAAESVMPESGETLSDNDSVFTLFYGKFSASGDRIKSLISMIEDRTEKNPVYQQYLDECHQVYFTCRKSLILPVLTSAIEDTCNIHGRSYCTLTRNSCRMLVHICKDEHQLFHQFFTHPSQFLIEFLESLCYHLYNVLRPIVIHINHLETLSELCCILRSEGTEEFTSIQGNESLLFGRALNSLLQDVQERLVYRTAIYIQTNIVEYVPAPGDLAYPEKLEIFLDIYLANNDSSLDRYSSQSPADIHGMWYPTVRRTIMCLAKLYRSLDKPAFQRLAQEVVAGCLESLKRAESEISKIKSQSDGCLFLIKHLLIIREQIAPFRIECSVREVEIDFSRMKTAAINLISNGRNIFSLKSNNGLLQFLFEVPGAPQVVDHVLDPQRIVDTEIKSTCEKFIDLTVTSMLIPIKSHHELLKRFIKSPEASVRPPVEETNEHLGEFTKHLEMTNSSIRKAMALYLANADTTNILFKPIKNKVIKQLEEIEKTINVAYGQGDRPKIKFQLETLEKLLLSSS